MRSLRCSLVIAVLVAPPVIALGETAAPPNAVVYFISPKNGDTVTSPFKLQFGLSGMGVAPAGIDKPNTGHHHLIIDATLSADELKTPIAADCQARSFRRRPDRNHGDATPRATHAQLVLRDWTHIPFNPPIVSPVGSQLQ